MNGPVKRRGGVSLLQDSSFLNQGFQKHLDEEYPSTLQATNYLSRRQMHAERISWEEIQENPREHKNPILFSEPGQRVIRAIRQLYGTRQGAISHSCAPKHGKSSSTCSSKLKIISRVTPCQEGQTIIANHFLRCSRKNGVLDAR